MTAARVRLLIAHAVLHAHFQSSPAIEDPLENLTKPNHFRQSSHCNIAATGRTDILGRWATSMPASKKPRLSKKHSCRHVDDMRERNGCKTLRRRRFVISMK